MFPKEIIIKIILFIYDFNTFKNFRLTEKFNYNICMNLWNKVELNYNFYPKKRLVNTKNCMVCKKYINSFNNLHLKHKSYPKPVYIFCNNWRCVNLIMNHMFDVSFKNNVIYLHNIINVYENKIKELNKYFLIKNKNINIHHEYIKNNKFYYRDYLINKKNYKILSWYRNNKHYKLLDLYKILR